jgi:hypothetical protein
MRVLKAIVVPTFILANLLPAAAQYSQQWKDCENGSDEKQIEACSAIIQAGHETVCPDSNELGGEYSAVHDSMRGRHR